MKGLKPHKFAELLPEMNSIEWEALLEDIRVNGQQEPIILYHGQILDGRNRYRAISKLNREPITTNFKGDDAEALALVKSRMMHRNLTESQKAAVAIQYLPEFEKLAVSRMKTGGVGTGSQGSLEGRATDNAGALFGVSGRYIQDARIIYERDRRLFDDVFNGRLPITRAKRQVVRNERRRNLLKKAKAAPAVADCTIEAGDCVWGMANRPAGKVRLIFADPPYNIGIDYGGGAKKDLLSPEQYYDWCNSWLFQAARLLTPDGAIFLLTAAEHLADCEMILRGAEEVPGLHRRNVIVWHETFGNHTAGNFTDCWRPILYYTRDPDNFVWHGDEIVIPSDRQTKYNDARADAAGKVPTNVWQFPRVADNHPERVPGFPTQLPLALVERIVKVASDPGDTVMDPFTGSGTTAVAACANGRKFIGFERNRKFAEMATLRVRAAMAERKG